MPRTRAASTSIALAVVLLAGAALPLAAQTSAPGRSASLERRMRDFVRTVGEMPLDSVAAFFPRRGDWAWVMTAHRDGKPDGVSVWRFAGSETLRAISPGGPVCQSFVPPGDTGFPNSLLELAMEHPRGWRRVRGSRFVPPGASARSPGFVEWRREDGEWVVSAFGDERDFGPRVLGVPLPTIVRDGPRAPPVPVERTYAAGARWFEEHVPLRLEGIYYLKYGLPRELADSEVVRFGSVGRVAVYAEAGYGGAPEVVYLAVRPGLYQPYNAFGTRDCLLGG